MRDKAEKAPEYTMEPAAANKRFPSLAVSGGALLLFVLAWNLLGDAFRDILDSSARKA